MEIVPGQEQSQESGAGYVEKTDDEVFNELLPQQEAPVEGQEQQQLSPQEQQVLNEMFSFSIGQDRFEAEGRHVPMELRQKLLEFAEGTNNNYNTRMNRYQELNGMQEQDVYWRGRAMWLQQEHNNLQQFISGDRFQQMLQDDEQKEQVQAVYARMSQTQNDYNQIVQGIQQQQQQMQYQQRMHSDDVANSSQMAIERRIPNFKAQHLDNVSKYLYNNYRDSNENIDMNDLRNQIMGNEVLAALAYKAERYDRLVASRKAPKPTNNGIGRAMNSENTGDGGWESQMRERLKTMGLDGSQA